MDEAATSEWIEGMEDWVAEPVLSVRSWYHRGTPMARVKSKVLLINPASFSETLVMNPAAFEAVSSYAHVVAASIVHVFIEGAATIVH